MTRALLIVAALLLSQPLQAVDLTAEQILQKADEVRSPASSYRMEVSVESADKSVYRFDIAIGGKDASLIRTLEPKREIGKNFLMLNEEMWAYIPNIKRAVRVTLNQKLTGQAANGDISRMRWFGDYSPVIESQTPEEWVLILSAQRKGLTYEKIRVWINKTSFRPSHGEYLTAQSTVLKKITFAEFSEIGGAMRPSKMVLENATKAEDFSILRIHAMKEANFAPTHFTQDNLR